MTAASHGKPTHYSNHKGKSQALYCYFFLHWSIEDTPQLMGWSVSDSTLGKELLSLKRSWHPSATVFVFSAQKDDGPHPRTHRNMGQQWKGPTWTKGLWGVSWSLGTAHTTMPSLEGCAWTEFGVQLHGRLTPAWGEQAGNACLFIPCTSKISAEQTRQPGIYSSPVHLPAA